MFGRIVLAMTVVLSLLWSTGAVADVNMDEGMWEITMKTEMPGMPVEMPPMTSTQCLTKKDNVPQQQEKDVDCTMVSHKIEGNTVSWIIKCRMKEGGTAESTGRVTYSGRSFKGTMKTVVMNEPSAGRMEVTQHMSGKRIGDCK